MSIPKIMSLAGCLFLVGCSTEKLPPKIQQSLDGAVTYIEQFRSSHSRVPSRDEYREWWKTNNLYGVVDYQIGGDGKTDEYVLYIWLGERMVRYLSKDKAIDNR
jgi:hypothetical protein